MATDELGIERDPSATPDDLGITRAPTASTGKYGIEPNPVANNGAYGAPGESGGHLPSFQTGQTGETNPANTASVRHQAVDPGLNLSSEQFNRQVGGYRPTSLLQGIGKNPGGLGMSSGDAARRLPTGEYLGSGNGQAADSWEPSMMLRLATGQDTL